jgi:hypothetical protein
MAPKINTILAEKYSIYLGKGAWDLGKHSKLDCRGDLTALDAQHGQPDDPVCLLFQQSLNID